MSTISSIPVVSYQLPRESMPKHYSMYQVYIKSPSSSQDVLMVVNANLAQKVNEIVIGTHQNLEDSLDHLVLYKTAEDRALGLNPLRFDGTIESQLGYSRVLYASNKKEITLQESYKSRMTPELKQEFMSVENAIIESNSIIASLARGIFQNTETVVDLDEVRKFIYILDIDVDFLIASLRTSADLEVAEAEKTKKLEFLETLKDTAKFASYYLTSLIDHVNDVYPRAIKGKIRISSSLVKKSPAATPSSLTTTKLPSTGEKIIKCIKNFFSRS